MPVYTFFHLSLPPIPVLVSCGFLLSTSCDTAGTLHFWMLLILVPEQWQGSSLLSCHRPHTHLLLYCTHPGGTHPGRRVILTYKTSTKDRICASDKECTVAKSTIFLCNCFIHYTKRVLGNGFTIFI